MIKIDRINRLINLNNVEIEHNQPIFKNGIFSHDSIKTSVDIARGIWSAQEGISVSGNVLNLQNGNNKAYIVISGSYYHFLCDVIGRFLSLLSTNPETEIIFDKGIMSKSIDDFSYIKFFLNKLSESGIEYTIIDSSQYDSIIIDNFSLLQFNTETSQVQLIYNFFKNHIKNTNIKPFRKVYVSRKKHKEKIYNNDKFDTSGVSYLEGGRIDSQEKIEKLFSDLGYEIIYSEDFINFEDQINFFYEVKTLVGLSGAGLTNSIFMQPGQTVVELLTPHIFSSPNKALFEELHFYYHTISAMKKHNYISINNFTRSSDALKEKIYSDKTLYNILKDNNE